jgi:MoaA/NifB/PqqE/SkfB family radical SAM enzyme
VLYQIEASVRRFVELGIRQITISGGDPLRIEKIVEFLGRMHQIGISSIKRDTVGTGLLPGLDKDSNLDIDEVLAQLDVLGLPLDGWSNATVSLFRHGRPRLYEETCQLLDFLSDSRGGCLIYINTVLHSGNLSGVLKIMQMLLRFACVGRWNIFEYTPTDQVSNAVNNKFRICETDFLMARDSVLTAASKHDVRFGIEFASKRERLGRYLPINSDGQGWLPDHLGRSVRLGCVYGREEESLELWADALKDLESKEVQTR